MRLPENIEKSAFHPGEYHGWDGTGQPWRIHKRRTGWRAFPAVNHRARDTAKPLQGATLTELGALLAARLPAKVTLPW
jgi:hypothetical protein